MSLKASEIKITGTVQGVGFRYFCLTHARDLNLTGWVKNLPNGSVHSIVEGDEQAIVQYLNLLQEGPHNSLVVNSDIEWVPYSGRFSQFEITK